jgi:hypothetical protein
VRLRPIRPVSPAGGFTDGWRAGPPDHRYSHRQVRDGEDLQTTLECPVLDRFSPATRSPTRRFWFGRGHPRSARGPIGRSGVTRRGPNAGHRIRFLRGRRERSTTARLALHLLVWHPARSAERPRRRDHRAGDPGVGGSSRICPPRRERTRGPENDPARIESRTHRGHRSPRPNRARRPTNCPMRPGRERQRLPAPTSAPTYDARSGTLPPVIGITKYSVVLGDLAAPPARSHGGRPPDPRGTARCGQWSDVCRLTRKDRALRLSGCPR